MSIQDQSRFYYALILYWCREISNLFDLGCIKSYEMYREYINKKILMHKLDLVTRY